MSWVSNTTLSNTTSSDTTLSNGTLSNTTFELLSWPLALVWSKKHTNDACFTSQTVDFSYVMPFAFTMLGLCFYTKYESMSELWVEYISMCAHFYPEIEHSECFIPSIPNSKSDLVLII